MCLVQDSVPEPSAGLAELASRKDPGRAGVKYSDPVSSQSLETGVGMGVGHRGG